MVKIFYFQQFPIFLCLEDPSFCSTVKEKKRWYNHFTIPILISTTVNSLGVFGVLIATKANWIGKYIW
jgi:hypothetical protein